MTTLDFNSVERDKYKQKGTDPAKERIENVIKAILQYGVHPKYVFKVDDVLQKKNTPKVVRCLEEVAKIVSNQHITGNLLTTAINIPDKTLIIQWEKINNFSYLPSSQGKKLTLFSTY